MKDAVLDEIRGGSQKLGLHQFPYCGDMKNMQDEGVQAKFNKGPVGLLILVPNGMPPMGKLLGQQIAFFPVRLSPDCLLRVTGIRSRG